MTVRNVLLTLVFAVASLPALGMTYENTSDTSTSSTSSDTSSSSTGTDSSPDTSSISSTDYISTGR